MRSLVDIVTLRAFANLVPQDRTRDVILKTLSDSTIDLIEHYTDRVLEEQDVEVDFSPSVSTYAGEIAYVPLKVFPIMEETLVIVKNEVETLQAKDYKLNAVDGVLGLKGPILPEDSFAISYRGGFELNESAGLSLLAVPSAMSIAAATQVAFMFKTFIRGSEGVDLSSDSESGKKVSGVSMSQVRLTPEAQQLLKPFRNKTSYVGRSGL